MKPARTLLPLLTIAAAGVGVAAQFVASTTTAPDLAPRNSNNAAALAARKHTQTVRTTRTTTKKPRPTSTKKGGGDDDDDDDDTTTRRNTRTRTRSRPTSPTARPTKTDSSSVSITPTPTPSGTSTPVPGNDTEKPGGGGLSAGAAAGIAAGAVTVVAIAAAVGFLLWRRRQGGIRGAVVTGDYPRGMNNGGEREPKLSPGGDSPVPSGLEHLGTEEEHNLRGGAATTTSRSSSGGGSGEALFQIPPAGTMPGEPGFENTGERPPPPAGTMPGEPGFGEYPPAAAAGGEYHHPHQQHQHPGGDLSQPPRPVSAFTAAYPSPNQPAFPVSPMTPWRPDSSILQHLPPRPQSQSQSQPRISSYYHPPAGSAVSSPGLPPPAFMVPGGDRSRAMSFSSAAGGGVAHVGGGPGHMAELVGSPPLPARPVPSFAVVVEEHEPGPEGGSASGGRVELPP